MNCLPDTSAWSLLLRRRPAGFEEHPVARSLRKQLEQSSSVFLTGVIYQEVLQGVRLEKQRLELIKHLAPFSMLDPDRLTHERAARLKDRCLRAGISVSTIDVLIAQVAIDFGCALLTADEDFQAIAKHSRLQLVAAG